MLKLLYALIVLLGTVFGATVAFQVDREFLAEIPGFAGYAKPNVLLAILLGGLGYFVSATLSWELERWVERRLPRLKIKDLLLGLAGLTSGFVVSSLFLIPMYFFVSAEPVKLALGSNSVFQTLTAVGPPFVTLLFGYLGLLMFLKKRGDSSDLFSTFEESSNPVRTKILDTSVIIDGRILDLIRCNVFEGTFIVPQAVLRELQHLSDGHDQQKRERGKRGLYILEELRSLPSITLEFPEDELPQILQVDDKLLRLTRDRDGILITNDMNLHKLAHIQEIRCVNLHEVSNALRPVVLPGESLELQLAKRGKEPRQGVGYLNDGTMVVVDNGLTHVGTMKRVSVISVLQTSAGRMVFARLDDSLAPSESKAPMPTSAGSGLAPGS